MNVRLRQIWSNVASVLAAEPPARRAALVAAGVGSLVLVLGLAWWVQRPLYRPLFTNLAPEDARAIGDALRAEQVDYRLDDGGRAVLVPADRLYELRLALASRGLPQAGGVGFELFDRQTFGQSEFVQRLNWQRALQGELGRTIAELGGVESARVHLAIPERSLFVSQDRAPSASVVVKLAAGRALARAQVDGIVHLVASSVEGLAPDGVTIVDEGGRLLTAGRRDETTAASDGALDRQRGLESAAEARIESMLGAVVGPGKVVARVAATLDLARTERTEETFDPDKTVLRETHTSREGGPSGRGAAGRGDAGGAPGTERRDETQTYEISKTVSRTVAPLGAVKQLSVAVLIDGTYRDENGTRTFVPRSDTELEKLRALVATAVGFDEARGDRIEITSAPFQTPAAEEGMAGGGLLARVVDWAPALAGRLFGVALLAVVLLVGVRPLVQALGAAGPRVQPRPGGLTLDRDTAVGELARENLALAQQHPERAAQLVRQWLLEGGKPTA